MALSSRDATAEHQGREKTTGSKELQASVESELPPFVPECMLDHLSPPFKKKKANLQQAATIADKSQRGCESKKKKNHLCL